MAEGSTLDGDQSDSDPDGSDRFDCSAVRRAGNADA